MAYLWFFSKEQLKNTPSRRDGVDFDTEKRYRREATHFIKECGSQMNLGYATLHTAIVYMHRFYMFHSFKTFPRYVTACASLFLAGKVEETPKKCRDIIKKASTILNATKMASFGEDPKEEVITMERILLKTIKFDLQVDHPYRFLIEYAKCLKSNGTTPKEQVVQKAWNFINDSQETTLCLEWEPEIIGIAMMHLACKFSKYDVIDWKGRTPDHQKWWDMFVKDMTKSTLEDICHQVLDLYTESKKRAGAPQAQIRPDSPPQLPPSKTSPPLKKPRLQQSPVAPKHVANQIPVKVSSGEYEMSSGIPQNSLHNPAYPGSYPAYPSTSFNSYAPGPNPPLPPSAHVKPPLPPYQIPPHLAPTQHPPPQTRYPLDNSRYAAPGYYPPNAMHYPPKNRNSNYHQYHQ